MHTIKIPYFKQICKEKQVPIGTTICFCLYTNRDKSIYKYTTNIRFPPKKKKNALILGHTNTNTHKTHAHKHRNKRTHKHEHSRFVKLESHDWVSSLVENTISFNKSQAHLYKLKQQLKCKWRN